MTRAQTIAQLTEAARSADYPRICSLVRNSSDGFFNQMFPLNSYEELHSLRGELKCYGTALVEARVEPVKAAAFDDWDIANSICGDRFRFNRESPVMVVFSTHRAQENTRQFSIKFL